MIPRFAKPFLHFGTISLPGSGFFNNGQSQKKNSKKNQRESLTKVWVFANWMESPFYEQPLNCILLHIFFGLNIGSISSGIPGCGTLASTQIGDLVHPLPKNTFFFFFFARPIIIMGKLCTSLDGGASFMCRFSLGWFCLKIGFCFRGFGGMIWLNAVTYFNHYEPSIGANQDSNQ